jgi:hypothetical protein
MAIFYFLLAGLSLALSGNILADPALINAEDVVLKLQVTLTSPLSSGETFKLGPFNDGELLPTTSKKNDKGHLERCKIKAPAIGVTVEACDFKDNQATVKLSVTASQDITFIMMDLHGYNNPHSASVPAALM